VVFVCKGGRAMHAIEKQTVFVPLISVCHSERRAKPEVEVLRSDKRSKTEER
jgi:hypothetical protein